MDYHHFDHFQPEQLGSSDFRQDYNAKYAYIAGAMYKGVASKELVIKMAKAKLLSFLGIGGLKYPIIEQALQAIQSNISPDMPYGVNLLHQLDRLDIELKTVELLQRYNVRNIEAAAFMQITPSLVWYRLKGIYSHPQLGIITPHRIIAKVSRLDVARAFISPAPQSIVYALVQSGKLTQEEANLSQLVPVAEDICVEADSGGHTDQRVAFVLLPAIISLRNELTAFYKYKKKLRVGAAGGIGSPEAAAAAFLMGADFILTGSINQCTVEAGTSGVVKNILQSLDIEDTTYAPAGDMFKLGARVQVVKKGTFFSMRANKLYELYRQHNSLHEIETSILQQIEEKYFGRSIDKVWEETYDYYQKENSAEIIKAQKDPKHKMALIFQWYFVHATRLALKGTQEQVANYQIQCGPAMGAFNRWLKGTQLEDWRNRHVDKIAENLMHATASLIAKRYAYWLGEKNNSAQLLKVNQQLINIL